MSSIRSEAIFEGVALQVRRNPRARRMRLAIDPRDGAVTLSLPARASIAKGLDWARQHRAWIETALAAVPEVRPLAPGAVLPWEGIDRAIEWRTDAPRRPVLFDDKIMLGGPRDAVASRLLAWCKQEAKRVLEAETRALADEAGLSVRAVAVGDPRSRWGSCSAAGDIRYSWRLMMAPSFVRRATIAHELAHRVHMNHAPAFHALAGQLTGFDPQCSRAWLKANGAALQRVSRLSANVSFPE